MNKWIFTSVMLFAALGILLKAAFDLKMENTVLIGQINLSQMGKQQAIDDALRQSDEMKKNSTNMWNDAYQQGYEAAILDAYNQKPQILIQEGDNKLMVWRKAYDVSVPPPSSSPTPKGKQH